MMVLELLQSLSEMQLVGDLTVLSLLIGGIIMAGGIIIAKMSHVCRMRTMFQASAASTVVEAALQPAEGQPLDSQRKASRLLARHCQKTN